MLTFQPYAVCQPTAIPFGYGSSAPTEPVRRPEFMQVYGIRGNGMSRTCQPGYAVPVTAEKPVSIGRGPKGAVDTYKGSTCLRLTFENDPNNRLSGDSGVFYLQNSLPYFKAPDRIREGQQYMLMKNSGRDIQIYAGQHRDLDEGDIIRVEQLDENFPYGFALKVVRVSNNQ